MPQEYTATSNHSGKRPSFFAMLLVLAVLIGVITSSPLGDGLMAGSLMPSITGLVGHFVPAVNTVADKTEFASAARLTFALQWLFFPAYFACLLWNQPPGTIPKPTKAVTDRIRRKGLVSLVFLAIVFSWFILSDFGFGPLSLFRGTVFDPTMANFFAHAPYEGRWGLAISAILSPLIEAFIYWVVLVAIGLVLRGVATITHRNRSPSGGAS
jgi:hypothetical protein